VLAVAFCAMAGTLPAQENASGTLTLKVATALASPPGLAATAYVAAIRRGSFDTFVNSLTGEAADSHRGAPGAARFAALRRDLLRDSAASGSPSNQTRRRRPRYRVTKRAA
jgi:hypothetical protein